MDMHTEAPLKAGEMRHFTFPLRPLVPALVPDSPAPRRVIAGVLQEFLGLALANRVIPRPALHPVTHVFRQTDVEEMLHRVGEAAAIAYV